MSAAVSQSEWVNAVEAAALLDVHRLTIPKLAARGRIAVRDLPVKARYRRADVERLARESVNPARKD